MNKKQVLKLPRPYRMPLSPRPVGHYAIKPNDPMVALANSAASPAPQMLTPEKLVKLVGEMCAAKGQQKDKLVVRVMEGFYGRRVLAEELRPVPRDFNLEKERIEKIGNGEDHEIFWNGEP